MAKCSIDHYFDEVIRYIPGTLCTAVNDLARNLNQLGCDLADMEDQFHNTSYRERWGDENFYQVNGGHNDTPAYALNLDSNGDGLSDLGEFFGTH